MCGAIKVVKAMSLPLTMDSEAILLLDWFASHTILAQFSQIHWIQQDSCVYRQPCAEDPQLSIVYSLLPDNTRVCPAQFNLQLIDAIADLEPRF